jgi:hypothetical protein
MKTYWGSGDIAPLILTLALDGGEWLASRPGCFNSRERAPGTHWIGGWMGPRAVLAAVVKRKIPSPRRESDPSTPIVQPVVQRYTDWAITAHAHYGVLEINSPWVRSKLLLKVYTYCVCVWEGGYFWLIRGSSVSRVTTTGWTIEVRFQAGKGIFSPSHHDQPSCGAHQASYTMGTGDYFPGVKRPGRKADHWPLVLKLRMSSVIHSLPPNMSS